ncbi:MAG TPA: hypothetical protein PKD54_04010 [Pirellulaceae bacterium]|nr:hypothetical protein [Pirellulaceae bacterium]
MTHNPAAKTVKKKRRRKASLAAEPVEVTSAIESADTALSNSEKWDCSGVAGRLVDAESKSFRKLFRCRWPTWVLWGLPDHCDGQTVATLLREITKSAAHARPQQWGAGRLLFGVPTTRAGQSDVKERDRSLENEACDVAAGVQDAMIMLGTTYRLPKIARHWSDEDSLQFEQFLQEDLFSFESTSPAREQLPWATRLIHDVEIPLVLATWVRTHPIAKPLAARALDHWQVSIDATLSDLGWNPDDIRPDFAACAAAHLRIWLLSKRFRFRLSDELRFRIEHLVLNAVRLWHPDGRLFAGGGTLSRSHAVLAVMEDMMSTRPERRLMNTIDTGHRGPIASKTKKLPDTGSFCEPTGIGIMRSDWSTRATAMWINANRGKYRISLSGRGELICGDAVPELQVSGRSIAIPTTTPELNLFHADTDVEYLELEWKLEAGVVWQRQCVLARREQFVVMADAVFSPAAPKIDYTCRFPLVNGIEICEEEETREVRLVTERPLASILPISMGEWKSDGLADKLVGASNQLCVHQSTRGSALWAVLVLDLDAQRCARPLTWRRLTVGENMQRVPSDQALAIRFQLGKQAFVIYRSLSGLRNRTYLGVNVFSELALGKVDRQGQVQQLLMVE